MSLHVASLCSCGTRWADTLTISQDKVVYTVFWPEGGNYIYLDPSTKAVIKTEEQFKLLVDHLGVSIEIQKSSKSQILISDKGKMKFVDLEMQEKYPCKQNACTEQLYTAFQSILEKEKQLKELYIRLQNINQRRKKRNIFDLFFGQSTASLATQVLLVIIRKYILKILLGKIKQPKRKQSIHI